MPPTPPASPDAEREALEARVRELEAEVRTLREQLAARRPAAKDDRSSG